MRRLVDDVGRSIDGFIAGPGDVPNSRFELSSWAAAPTSPRSTLLDHRRA